MKPHRSNAKSAHARHPIGTRRQKLRSSSALKRVTTVEKEQAETAWKTHLNEQDVENLQNRVRILERKEHINT